MAPAILRRRRRSDRDEGQKDRGGARRGEEETGRGGAQAQRRRRGEGGGEPEEKGRRDKTEQTSCLGYCRQYQFSQVTLRTPPPPLGGDARTTWRPRPSARTLASRKLYRERCLTYTKLRVVVVENLGQDSTLHSATR